MAPRFEPLECNPTVFNELLQKLGVKGVEFNDIYSLDPELLAFMPRPVVAVLLVFPTSEAYESYRLFMDKDIPDYEDAGTDKEDAIWYKQTIGNACGTMALLHAIANAVPASSLTMASKKLIEETAPLSSEKRVEYLESCTDLASAHAQMAQKGDTTAPDASEDVIFHYVCLTKSRKSNRLVELDGRRKGPIYRGGPKDDDILDKEALDVIQEFMDRESGESFSLIALSQVT